MMSALAPFPSEVPAANRAQGRVALAVAARFGASRRKHVHEAGSLRVRFPNGERPDRLDAVILNSAGGMTGGDQFEIAVNVGCGARLTVTSGAAEKVYRSPGPSTSVTVKLTVADGGSLAWLPQETIVFNRVRLERSISVTLDPGADLLLAEAIVFGRSAMGEVVDEGHLVDRWRVRIGDRLAFAETLRLDGMIAPQLARPACAAGGVAVATVIKFPGSGKDVETIRAATDDCAGEVGASAWNGLAVARLVAPDGAALRRDLVAVVSALGRAVMPRLWLN